MIKGALTTGKKDHVNAAEVGQMITRINIISAFVVIVTIRHFILERFDLYFYNPIEIIALLTGFSGLSFSIFLLIRARLKGSISIKRRIVATWLDVTYITILVANCNQIGVLSVGLYFWVIFGNGFRFGPRYLYHTQAVSIIGFFIGSSVGHYWDDINDIKYCLLIMLVGLPFYVSMLLKMLHKEKQASVAASMAKSNFIASISHEIRTPLAGILGISTLLKNPKSEEDKDHLLKILDNSSKILMSLLNNVLDISKIEENQLVMEYSNFELNSVIGDTTAIFEGQATSKNIRLEYTSLISDIHVFGCMGLVQQVITNLIGNAIKFTDKGAVTVSIQQLSRTDETSLIRFEVLDTGIGISQEAQDKIFNKFSQSRESDTRMYGGSGLGLYISNKIVQSMGSTLHVISQEGLGSKFYFDINFKLQADGLRDDKAFIAIADENEPAENEPTIIDEPTPANVIPFKPVKNDDYLLNILLCEDDHVNQQVTTRILELPGHSVTLAKDSDEFLDLLEQYKFDVVISDLNIPGRSGIESVKLYRFINPTDKDTKFIMLSAEATKEAIEEAGEANFNKFLTKPVDIATLYSAIAEVKELPKEAIDKWMGSIVTKNKKTNKHSGSLDPLKMIELEVIGQSDPEFISLVINTYLQDALILIKNIEQNIKSKKYSNRLNHCHALNGISSVIGADIIVREVNLLENATDEELLFRGTQMINNLNNEYQQVKLEVEEYLTQRQVS